MAAATWGGGGQGCLSSFLSLSPHAGAQRPWRRGEKEGDGEGQVGGGGR